MAPARTASHAKEGAPGQTALVDRIDATLPQTQCTRCGFPDCRSYAAAIASGEARINRCPPGGAEGIVRLAALTGAEFVPLDRERGAEKPRSLAIIDEAWCIGCTLCIKACPVDCIIGAPKLMHSVIDEQCNGCELCIPACPVDCIAMEPVTAMRTGWQAWSQEQADRSRQLYEAHNQRRARAAREHDLALAAKAQAKLADLAGQTTSHDEAALARKRAVIEAALARAQARAEAENPPRDDR